jgi:hypothetical protein
MTALISYSHRDRALARRISQTLSRFNLEHWWDDRIEISTLWNDALEKRLRAASSVLVLWTDAAATSQWVLHEATVARDRRTLVQVRIGSAPLPDDFTALQAADLPVWEENTLPRGIRSA